MSQSTKTITTKLLISAGFIASACFTAAAALAQPVIGPQVRADTGGGVEAANETSCASTDLFPNEIVAVWNDWRRSTSFEIINMGVGVSLDGGTTWTDFLVRPPAQNQSSVEGDPMTAYDNRTGTLWVGAISFASNGGLYVAKKIQGSNNFEPSVQIGQQSFADKCWMAAGPAPGNPNATMVYIAYNEGLWRSADMGQTWQGPVNIGFGIGFLPRIAPNGDLFVSWWDFGNGHWVRKSTDGGLTFKSAVKAATRLDVWGTQDGSRFPGTFRSPSMNTMAIDPNDGTMYIVYSDTTDNQSNGKNVDLYFTKSTDGGNSWSTPVVINQDAATPGDQFFPWLEVDKTGMLHMVYYDSRNTIQNDNVVNGMFDAYYMYSTDHGTTWSEAKLTPAPFNSDDDGLNRSTQFIGDYNGLGVGDNRVYPCYLSNQNGDSDIFVNTITIDNNNLVLSDPVPGLVNQNNSIKAGNATPAEEVTFVYGLQSGITNVSGCTMSLDIMNAKILGKDIADNSGSASVTFFVPSNAAGHTVYFQAGQRFNCTKSNAVKFAF